jgi:predicted mannosyl-3-phosphoglycerate phosphatase (HAD superfamily)
MPLATPPPPLSPPVVGVSTTDVGTGSRPLVILTCVDGALRESASGSCAGARQVIESVARRGITIVLVSHHSAAELLALQEDLGIAVPFIAANGGSLHTPRGESSDHRLVDRRSGEWDVIEFTPPSVEDALDALLCTDGRHTPLLVGIGATWPDHVLLRHVHVPVVVRSRFVDQAALCDRVPHAYVTHEVGPRGWCEAILGSA